MSSDRSPARRVLRRVAKMLLAPAVTWLGRYNDERFCLSVERLSLSIRTLAPVLDGLRVAHLSDFHLSEALPLAYLEESVARCNALQPDLIVLTGDFVTTGRAFIEPCARALAALQAPLGCFAVLGNHDYWAGADAVATALTQQGIRVLRNDGLELSPGFWLLGLEDAREAQPDLAGTLARLRVPADAAVLVLVHEPDLADLIAAFPVDLQLSGHTHGGQFRLPLLGRPFLPRLGKRYPEGLARLGRLHLYTSRGLGFSDVFPLRFRCPPELTLLTLRAVRQVG